VSKSYRIGHIFGLDIYLLPLFFLGTLLMWAGLIGIGVWLLDLQIQEAIISGLAATLLYWLSGMIHYLGHAFAAQSTDYPMSGIRLGRFVLLGETLFPENEPILPGRIHIRRALGGPVANLIVSTAVGLFTLTTPAPGGMVRWLALFFILSNFVVYTLGALLPLGFTDGSTLLTWWNQR